jgi:hypothetical protein
MKFRKLNYRIPFCTTIGASSQIITNGFIYCVHLPRAYTRGYSYFATLWLDLTIAKLTPPAHLQFTRLGDLGGEKIGYEFGES